MSKRLLTAMLGMLAGAAWAWAVEPMPCHVYPGPMPQVQRPFGNWPLYRPPAPAVHPLNRLARMPAPYAPPLEPAPLARSESEPEGEVQVAALTPRPDRSADVGTGSSVVPASNMVVVQPAGAPPTYQPAAPYCLDYFPEPPRPHGWVGFDYQVWWIKDGPLPIPIATFGPEGQSGAIGEPGTVVLIGNDDIDYGDFSAVRARPGWWLDQDRKYALEGTLFLTEGKQVFQQASSDAVGQGQLARPFLNAGTGNEVGLAISFPGDGAGNVGLTASSIMHGWEANITGVCCDAKCWRLQWLGGFRSLLLDEDIRIIETFRPLVAGVANVGANPVAAGDLVGVFDRFGGINRFYGPQLGGRVGWQRERLSVVALGKVAVGWTEQQVIIEGTSAIVPADGSRPTVVPGGVLAQVSNIGRYNRDRFAVVPELGLDVGVQLTDQLSAKVGYSVIVWTNVARPGQQMDHALTDTLIPTSQFFNAFPTNTFFPRFAFQEELFWAQAMSFGLTYEF
jgi:hypothetical protein